MVNIVLPSIRKRRGSRVTRPIQRLGLSLVPFVLSLIVLTPFAIVLFSSLKTRREITRNPLGIPDEVQFGNYLQAWNVGHFDRYFLNSVYVVVPTILLVLAFSLLIAYAVATMHFRNKNLILMVLLLGLAIPLDILIIPLFYNLLNIGLLNTHWALILPIAAKIIPFGVLLLRGFIAELPVEILDAGLIDGCSRFQLLRFVVAPLCRPALASLLVFTFMWTWNMFVLPVVLIQEDAMRTLPVGLNYFQGRFTTDTPLLMAGAMITSMPIILVYMLFQRHFIKGITAGAVK